MKGNWWEDWWLNQRQKEKNCCHHGTSPGDRRSNQYLRAHYFALCSISLRIHFDIPALLSQSGICYLWALDVKQWIKFERKGRTKSTHLLPPLSLLPQFPHRVMLGRWKIHPALLLLPPALPFTHQIESDGGFWPSHWPLRAVWLSVFMIRPQRNSTQLRAHHKDTHTHTLLFFNPSL